MFSLGPLIVNIIYLIPSRETRFRGQESESQLLKKIIFFEASEGCYLGWIMILIVAQLSTS